MKEPPSGFIVKPKVLDEIAVVPLEDGVLIDGFARLEVIRGPLAQTILPSLLTLMNGMRTLEELAAAFPDVPPNYIHDTVAYMSGCGLVSGVPAADITVGFDEDTVCFLRRAIGNSRLDCSTAECCTRLQGARVKLLAVAQCRESAELLQMLLRDSGVRSVEIIHEPLPVGKCRPEDLLIILDCDAALGSTPAATLDGLPQRWFRATLDEDSGYADLGPYFSNGNASCWNCFASTHIGSSPASRDFISTSRNQAMFAGLVAMETLYALALPQIALTGRTFRRIQLKDLASQVLAYPRIPGCPRCRPNRFLPLNDSLRSRPANTLLTDTAFVFEDYVGIETRRVLSQNPHDRLGTSVPETIEDSRLLNCEHISLGTKPLTLSTCVADIGEETGAGAAGSYSIEDLGAILAMTAGLRERNLDGKARRWAPTAGNLGSVELCVAVRNVDGLRPGFYFYLAENHSLVAFRRRSGSTIDEFMHRCIGRPEGSLPDALVLFTGALHRVFAKYSAFAYKLIFLDAGAALSQLHYVAKSMRLSARTVPRWVAAIIEREFNLHSGTEISTAVVELSHRPPRDPQGWFFRKKEIVGPEAPPSWHAPNDFQGQTTQEIMERLQQESRLTEAQLSTTAFGGQRKSNGRIQSCSYQKLPDPAKPTFPLGHVLAERKSIREYSKKPVPVHFLHTMLKTAHKWDLAEWSHEVRDNNVLKLLVLARAASGIAPGVYACRPDGQALSFRSALPTMEEALELFVQPEFVEAPVFIWITGNIAFACARHGAFGHRQLLLRAGAAGHRLWACAIALGLTGCLVAGLVPGAARTILGLDAYEELGLLGFAVGYEGDQSHLSKTAIG